MPTVDDEIRSQTAAFAADIAALVRRAALEAVTAALGGHALIGVGTGAGKATLPAALHLGAKPAAARATHAGTSRTTASKPAVKVAPTAPAAPTARASHKGPAPKRAPGEKRPPSELAKIVDKLGEYIKAHPGLRMEAIGKALGMPTRELNLPVKKLLAGKRIRVQGLKRATEYFPA